MLNRNLAALDPHLRRLVDGLENHGPTAGAGNETEEVVEVLQGAGVEFAVEGLVEGSCRTASVKDNGQKGEGTD